jgi:hypothetical protein
VAAEHERHSHTSHDAVIRLPELDFLGACHMLDLEAYNTIRSRIKESKVFFRIVSRTTQASGTTITSSPHVIS